MTSLKDSNSICFRLNPQSEGYARSIVDRLHNYRSHIPVNQKILQAISALHLPFAISKSDKDYEQIVVEALAFYQSQIKILENISGLTLNDSNSSANVNFQDLSSTGSAFNQVHSDNIQASAIQTKEEETIESESLEAAPILKSIDQLKSKINELFSELENGESCNGVERLIMALEPDEEDAWTEDMWDAYDSARNSLVKIAQKEDDLAREEAAQNR